MFEKIEFTNNKYIEVIKDPINEYKITFSPSVFYEDLVITNQYNY